MAIPPRLRRLRGGRLLSASTRSVVTPAIAGTRRRLFTVEGETRCSNPSHQPRRLRWGRPAPGGRLRPAGGAPAHVQGAPVGQGEGLGRSRLAENVAPGCVRQQAVPASPLVLLRVSAPLRLPSDRRHRLLSIRVDRRSGRRSADRARLIAPGWTAKLEYRIEAIRKRFLPERITTLFVGESAPHSGDFFYCGNNAMLPHMKCAVELAFGKK
jgi:hypothetical protein